MAVSTLSDYIEVLKRRWRVVLLAVVIVPVAAVLLAGRQPALYEASAQVLISSDSLATQLEGLSNQTAGDPERNAQTEAQLARGPEVARRALGTAQLDRSPSDLLDASSVTAAPEADLLIFSVRDSDPDVAASLANAYARQFTVYRRELEADTLKTARARIQGEIEALQDRGDDDSAAYDALLEKDQQLLAMEALQTGQATVVRVASDSTQIQPRPKQAASIGFVLGIVLGIALAFLWEALDSRVRSAQDVAARLRLPLLGRIPWPLCRGRRSKQLVMLSAPYSKAAEAFRVLRSNVEFAALDRGRLGGRILMVTSAQADEGKSTTIANLAIAFAHDGRRTILVDLNFRNSCIEKLFGVEDKPGVTDVVSGHVSLESALIRRSSAPDHIFAPEGHGVADNGLWVLPSGAVNPVDVGAARQLPELLRDLSERADIVLIDAPPLLDAGDAIALTAHVDGIMVVTRANLNRAATLDELRRVLEVTPAVKLGFIHVGSKDVDGYYDGNLVPAATTNGFASGQHLDPDIDAEWRTEGAPR
jgi:capsular exopolysaccharide synthesis family protein